MSYILEGLKKLERKRRREGSPKGYVFSPGEEILPVRKRPLWPFLILTAALLVNAAVWVGWWYFLESPSHRPSKNETTSLRSIRPTPPTPMEKEEVKRPAEKAPQPFSSVARPEQGRDRPTAPDSKDSLKTKAPLAVPPLPSSAPEKARPAGDGTLWKMGELPAEVRQQLPPLKMSLHYYSPVQEERFVVINQRNLREGDSLREDLKVAEIQPHGVILHFKNQRILLGIQEGP